MHGFGSRGRSVSSGGRQAGSGRQEARGKGVDPPLQPPPAPADPLMAHHQRIALAKAIDGLVEIGPDRLADQRRFAGAMDIAQPGHRHSRPNSVPHRQRRIARASCLSQNRGAASAADLQQKRPLWLNRPRALKQRRRRGFGQAARRERPPTPDLAHPIILLPAASRDPCRVRRNPRVAVIPRCRENTMRPWQLRDCQHRMSHAVGSPLPAAGRRGQCARRPPIYVRDAYILCN